MTTPKKPTLAKIKPISAWAVVFDGRLTATYTLITKEDALFWKDNMRGYHKTSKVIEVTIAPKVRKRKTVRKK